MEHVEDPKEVNFKNDLIQKWNKPSFVISIL